MASRIAGMPICMLGCDQREVDLAKALVRLEVDLRLVGFPEEGELQKALHFTDAEDAVVGSRCIIAPMSNTDLAGRITARLDGISEAVDLTVLIPLMPPGTPLLLGVAKPIIKGLVTQYRLRLVEIAEIDEIAVLNSIPTAEGAIQVAMEETDITIHGSRCLVLGLGRCGTTLTQRLVGLGAQVTVVARSSGDLARAAAMNTQPLPIANLNTQHHFDIIFNTVPALVLPRSYLRLLPSSSVIIDIAASPGGTDFAAAEQLGIKAISALSLPGKVAPRTAGEILVRAIPRLLEQLLGEDYHDY